MHKHLLLLLVLVVAMSATVTVASSYVSDFDKLYRSLFADYNSELAPNRNITSKTTVKFSFAPICLDLDRQGVLKGRVWYRMQWTDERLAFNPEEFGGVKVIRVNPHKLWLPDVTLYNRQDAWNPMFPGSDSSFSSNALIYSSGLILWVPDRYAEARCNGSGINLHDRWADQSCTLKYGSWTFDGNFMDLQPYDEALDVEFWSDTCPMEVVKNTITREDKFYDCCPGEPYTNLQFHLTLRRRYVVTDEGVLMNPKKAEP